MRAKRAIIVSQRTRHIARLAQILQRQKLALQDDNRMGYRLNFQ
jgi:hypothetical protein